MILSDRKIRFSDVAFGVEATQQALRRMLQNPDLIMPGWGRDGGWRDFSLMEIAILAIARRLIEFGFSVRDASAVGCSVVVMALRKSGMKSKSVSALSLSTVLMTTYIIVRMIEGQRRMEVVTADHLNSIDLDDMGTGPVLVVPVGAVVSRAYGRAILGADYSIEDLREILRGARLQSKEAADALSSAVGATNLLIEE